MSQGIGIQALNNSLAATPPNNNTAIIVGFNLKNALTQAGRITSKIFQCVDMPSVQYNFDVLDGVYIIMEDNNIVGVDEFCYKP